MFQCLDNTVTSLSTVQHPLYRGHLKFSPHVLSCFSPGPFCCQEEVAPLAGPPLPAGSCGPGHVHPHVPDTDQLPQHQTDGGRVTAPPRHHPKVAFRALPSSLPTTKTPFCKLFSSVLAGLSGPVSAGSHLPHPWCCFEATRKKASVESVVVKQIWRRNRFNPVFCILWKFTMQSLKQHTGRNNQFFSPSFLFFQFFSPFLIAVNKDLFLTHCPSRPVYWLPMISAVWCIIAHPFLLFFVKSFFSAKLSFENLWQQEKEHLKGGVKAWIYLPSPFLPWTDWELSGLFHTGHFAWQAPCSALTHNVKGQE